MFILKKLFGVRVEDVAELSIVGKYSSSAPQSDELPQLEVATVRAKNGLDERKMLYLAAAGVAEHSFFRLYGNDRDRALRMWSQLLSGEGLGRLRVAQSANSGGGTSRVVLRYGQRAPFVTITPEFGEVQLTPARIVSDFAFQFFRWSQDRLQGEFKDRLLDTVKAGLEKWKISRPTAKESTWSWLKWIDYPMWIFEVFDEYGVGKSHFEYVRYRDNITGISLKCPDFYLPGDPYTQQDFDVVDFTYGEGHMLRVYKDRGHRVENHISDLSLDESMSTTIRYWQDSLSGEGKRVVNPASPKPSNFQEHQALVIELVVSENGSEIGRLWEAVCKPQEDTIAGMYAWFDTSIRWMMRDVLRNIMASVKFYS